MSDGGKCGDGEGGIDSSTAQGSRKHADGSSSCVIHSRERFKPLFIQGSVSNHTSLCTAALICPFSTGPSVPLPAAICSESARSCRSRSICSAALRSGRCSSRRTASAPPSVEDASTDTKSAITSASASHNLKHCFGDCAARALRCLNRKLIAAPSRRHSAASVTRSATRPARAEPERTPPTAACSPSASCESCSACGVPLGALIPKRPLPMGPAM
eukprot:1964558-Rhodomonas_salina.2